MYLRDVFMNAVENRNKYEYITTRIDLISKKEQYYTEAR